MNRKRILVVDDVELHRMVLRTPLEHIGAIIDEATNGEEAVKLFLQNEYDLILMDLSMPVMDGFTATKNIRASALPGAQTIPIISVSAESGADIPSRCVEAGINDYCAKPVNIEKFLKTITRWLPV